MSGFFPRRVSFLWSSGTGVMLMLAIFVVFPLVVTGCGRKPAPPRVVTPRSTSPKASPANAQDLKAAQDAVERYLNALSIQDYRGAYALLSAESKRQHPFNQFEKDAKDAQVQYDLTSAKATATGANTADVTLSMPSDEEPGEKTFATIREEGRWKVQYYGGVPFSPYGE
jgi:hypothetical protein